MPLDPGIIVRTVHIEMVKPDGTPRSGSLTFTNSRMGDGEQTIPEYSQTVTLDETGEATIDLVANLNNPEISPNNTYYTVLERLENGYQRTRYVQVDGAVVGTVEYDSLLQTEPGVLGSTYVTQAQLLQAVADAIAALDFDPSQFARLTGADPITGTYVWEIPEEIEPTEQIGAIRIVVNHDVDPDDSPDLYGIYFKPTDPDNLTDADRSRWDNEWGGIRIRIPTGSKLGYGDVGMKIFESTGSGKALEIYDNTGALVFHVQGGVVTAKGIVTTAGPNTFGGNTTMAGTLGVTGAVTMSSTLAVTGQVTVPTTPTAAGHATSKSYVDSVAGGGGGGVPTSRQIATTAPLAGGGDLTADRTLSINNDGVTNAILANMAQSTIKGRAVGAGTGDPTDLTVAQILAMLALDYTNWVSITSFTSPFSAYTQDTNGGTPQVRVVNLFGTNFVYLSGRIAMSGGATDNQDICDIPTSLTWQGAGGTVSAVPARRRQWPTGSDGAGAQRIRATSAGKLQIVGSLAAATVLYLDSGLYRLD